MKKILGFALLWTIGLIGCKTAEKEIDKIEVARQYFQVLDQSDYSKMAALFGDSLVTIEGDYTQVYSQNEYLEFLKWDAVFDPKYEVLEMEQVGAWVKAKISKRDKRILFLQEKPFITNQLIRFQNDKIISIETDYVNFDYPIWERNRDNLLNWIKTNHPELDGFIFDQTEAGGLKFLKAIELYKNKKAL